MSVALTDTASSTDAGNTPWASATLVFGDTDNDVHGASESITGGDGIVIDGSRPAVEKYLERAFVPIAALLEVHPAPSEVRQVPISTRKRFQELADRWLEESAHLSSINKMAMLSSYQQIIGLGPDAAPLILEHLRQEPSHWFWALQAITGVNPVSPEHAGRVRDMAEDWIRWGQEHGMLA